MPDEKDSLLRHLSSVDTVIEIIVHTLPRVQECAAHLQEKRSVRSGAQIFLLK